MKISWNKTSRNMENTLWDGYRSEESSSDDETQRKNFDYIEVSSGEERDDFREPSKNEAAIEAIARRIQKVKLLGNSRRKTRAIIKLHKRMQECLDHRRFLEEKIIRLQAENKKLLQDLSFLQIQAA